MIIWALYVGNIFDKLQEQVDSNREKNQKDLNKIAEITARHEHILIELCKKNSINEL